MYFPKCCGWPQQTGGHPGMCNTLRLWSLLAIFAPNPKLHWQNEVALQYHKTNKVSLCPLGPHLCVQTAVACQFGTDSVIGHPAVFWKCSGITKSICVCLPFSLHLHETVNEHRDTCGPEWYNNNFVSSGNDAFPGLGNTKLRLEQRTGNWEDKHLLVCSCGVPFYTF